jgi:hypothetical protein
MSEKRGQPTLSFNRIAAKAVSTPKPKFTGSWATVEIQPDPFAPQRFTIGVVVQGSDERLHFKLLDGFQKFDCLYGDRFPQTWVAELMAYAEHALRAAAQSRASLDSVVFGAPSLSLGPSLFTAGMDQEEAVEKLYAELVVMAPHAEPKKEKGFQFIDTPTARRMVNEHLKEIAKLDFNRIVAEGSGILLADAGANHFLDLNLTPPGCCGSVISAVYALTQTVEMNLHRAARDLTTYARIRSTDDTGLFMLLPPPKALDAKERIKMEKLLADYQWKLERDGFRVVSHESPGALASDVYEWAKPHLPDYSGLVAE